ncbi:transcriptional regulator [Streptomyces sp. SL54]|uniref:Transcriptional regulator n=2 Tax=Streptantibioticus silvisoli TaxID=2705255 RepID=A0ABT6W8M5_9ACTN|nr:transcriptional regulator [Streptantibioticus silvisoli]
MIMSADLRQRRAVLEDAWSRWVPVGGAGAASRVRPEVADSWRRSLGSVDPGRDSAPVFEGGAVQGRWSHSPLRRPVEELAGELRTIADDAGFVAAVTDGTGTILWTCGGRVMRRRAERVNFAPGGRWDEAAMGTNALSLALRTGRAHSVFSAEHLVEALHGWVCYCAPITGPDGRVLGVLDLSTTWDRSHPLAMSTVRTLVTAIEDRLPSAAPPPAAAPAVRLECLGGAAVTRGGGRLALPPRQVEILALLALEPDGFTPERLREALYGDRRVSASTFKAEVSRLRRALDGHLATRTYALTRPVACDAVELLDAVRRGDTGRAVRLRRGPLLPRSEAPGVRVWRDHLEVTLREAVLSAGSADDAVRYGERVPHDAEMHHRALGLLDPLDARRAPVVARLTATHTD